MNYFALPEFEYVEDVSWDIDPKIEDLNIEHPERVPKRIVEFLLNKVDYTSPDYVKLNEVRAKNLIRLLNNQLKIHKNLSKLTIEFDSFNKYMDVLCKVNFDECIPGIKRFITKEAFKPYHADYDLSDKESQNIKEWNAEDKEKLFWDIIEDITSEIKKNIDLDKEMDKNIGEYIDLYDESWESLYDEFKFDRKPTNLSELDKYKEEMDGTYTYWVESPGQLKLQFESIAELNEAFNSVMNTMFTEEYDFGNDKRKPYIIQVDSNIENADELIVIGCDNLKEAEDMFRSCKRQYQDEEDAEFLSLSKLEEDGYERVKVYDLKEKVYIK